MEGTLNKLVSLYPWGKSRIGRVNTAKFKYRHFLACCEFSSLVILEISFTRKSNSKVAPHVERMTFYHFGNCIALAYLPYYLAYKYSGLSEYGAFWKCIQTGFIYAFTQLCKMLVLATFFPIPAEEALSHGETFSNHEVKDRFAIEFFKDSMDLVDLIGMYVALSRIPGRGHSKVLTAGIGWGTADLLLTRVFAIWVGAKGIEFNWRYIQMALDANISLIHNVAIAALVWVWSRHDTKPAYYPVAAILAGISCYRNLLVNVLLQAAFIDPWTILIIKAIVTLLIGASTIRVYSTVA